MATRIEAEAKAIIKQTAQAAAEATSLFKRDRVVIHPFAVLRNSTEMLGEPIKCDVCKRIVTIYPVDSPGALLFYLCARCIAGLLTELCAQGGYPIEDYRAGGNMADVN